MKRVFLDTNFIIDYLIREDYSGVAEKVIQTADAHYMDFYISYLSVANFAYIMRKLSPESLCSLIRGICNTFRIVENTKSQILRNLEYQVVDFEDGLQYQSALSAECEGIITRNKKDFSFSKIPVYTPEEFLISFPLSGN